jgi:carboxyl-terminal processing protease
MKPARSLLLVASVVWVVFLLGGGLLMRVRASENPYQQAVLFAEILSLVLENYVDPVEAESLLEGAYEGMLGGLDPNGAYLTADEVREWKRGRPAGEVDPGLSVLKSRMGLRVIAVDPGSDAEREQIHVGDQIRSIDGRAVRSLSLAQARRLLRGAPGSRVTLELLPVADGFVRRVVEVARAPRRGRAWELRVERGVAVLGIHDLGRIQADVLASELDDVRSGGVERLLLDLRNQADEDPRHAIALAGLFESGELLRLRSHKGELVETLSSAGAGGAWPGQLSVLVNWATAGAAEALTRLVQSERGAQVYGEATFGLGAEPELLPLDSGAALLVSAARWETPDGQSWNGAGITPDRIVEGSGETPAAVGEDQLRQVLDLLNEPPPAA